jgi:hypothetical protein
MVSRFTSFLRSSRKQALLYYGYHELKERLGRFLPSNQLPVNPAGCISLAGQTGRLYGFHRSGWRYAVDSLVPLHNPQGVMVDMFMDRTFAADTRRRTVYTSPWIGFTHVPPAVPPAIASLQSNDVVLSSPEFVQSLPQCRGIFTLSSSHRDFLASRLPVPVETLLHPTEFPPVFWEPERFLRNQAKKIIQSGWWLRRATSIHLLDAPGYHKMVLEKMDVDANRRLREEWGQHGIPRGRPDQVRGRVEVSGYLSDREYDRLLSENILFLDLIDASANNAIIECIARSTPVLVNPLPAVTEYLGTAYPFYFESLEEASAKVADPDLILKTHAYLSALPIRERLTGDAFLESFSSSTIYRSL